MMLGRCSSRAILRPSLSSGLKLSPSTKFSSRLLSSSSSPPPPPPFYKPAGALSGVLGLVYFSYVAFCPSAGPKPDHPGSSSSEGAPSSRSPSHQSSLSGIFPANAVLTRLDAGGGDFKEERVKANEIDADLVLLYFSASWVSNE